MKNLILTHANCVDGCCSCAILKEKYKDDAIYIELDYIDADPAYPEKFEAFHKKTESIYNSNVIMADICLKAEVVKMFLNRNNDVTIIDHHATAIPIVKELEEYKKKNEHVKLNIYFSYDNQKSGAMLTWNYLNPGVEPPLLIKIVEDYDLWRFSFGDETKAFHAKLLDNERQPKDYDKSFFSELLHDSKKIEKIIEEGRLIYKNYMSTLEKYAEQAIPVSLKGYTGLMVNAPMKYRSDLGDIVNKKSGTFALIWEEQADGIVSCSLRSVKDFNVKTIAESFGGGGHENAAAFRAKSIEDFNEIIKKNKISRPKFK